MTMHPSIDHSILSPSGRMSKRARAAALKIEHDRLFPPGFWDTPPLTVAEQNKNRATRLRRSAANLLDLAEKGITPRKFRRIAAEWLAEADSLDPKLP